jgi:hypothetical protein
MHFQGRSRGKGPAHAVQQELLSVILEQFDRTILFVRKGESCSKRC